MFIGLTDQELLDDKLELAAALTVMAPIDIALSTTSGKPYKPEAATRGEPIRQPIAEARLFLAEKLRDVVDKEKRELRLVFRSMISLEKFASRKSEICLEITIQRVTGTSLDAIK
uniref:NR LBD domain-containing protein n=1 Tax=Panagrellus redivivus TaxID=6233 RepID=A0A7E4URG1_PANRE